GSHALSGRFVWEARPEALAIPTQTALLDLLVDGQRVLQPERPGGRLALGRRGTAAEPRRLDVQVYRLVEDDIPLRLVTRLRLRVAAVEGVAGIDPAQANVPEEWRRYPAFRMAPGSELRIVERSRGLSNTDQNRLHLRRRLWLDFDHDGLTAVDEVSGTLRRD